MNVLEVKFIGDEDALEHIVDKQEGMDDCSCVPAVKFCEVSWMSVVRRRRADVQSSKGNVQEMVTLKIPAGRRARDAAETDEDENGRLDEQNYIQALGADNIEGWFLSDLRIGWSDRIRVLSLPIWNRDVGPSLAFDMDLFFFFWYDKMRMKCPGWPEPRFSPFRKSNGDTAWLRQVRAFVLMHVAHIKHN